MAKTAQAVRRRHVIPALPWEQQSQSTFLFSTTAEPTLSSVAEGGEEGYTPPRVAHTARSHVSFRNGHRSWHDVRSLESSLGFSSYLAYAYFTCFTACTTAQSTPGVFTYSSTKYRTALLYSEATLVAESRKAKGATRPPRGRSLRSASKASPTSTLRASSYLHSKGVIHRDIKPMNSLCTRAL